MLFKSFLTIEKICPQIQVSIPYRHSKTSNPVPFGHQFALQKCKKNSGDRQVLYTLSREPKIA